MTSITQHLRRAGLALAAAAALAAGGAAQAYTTFPGDAKWGAGGPGSGATVTWSVMPEGTGVLRTPDTPGFLFQDFWSGDNDLGAVYAQLGPDEATGRARFMSALQAAFDTWSAAADLHFVQVVDDGSPLGFVGPTAGRVGDIRIGAFGFLAPFDAFAGHTFEPPGGSSPLAAYWNGTGQKSDFGDVNLNKWAFFSTFEGLAEGDSFGGFPNDLQGLLVHEIGHALGLGHPEEDGVQGDEALSVMYVGPGCCTRIHRQLGSDDIAGIRALYGAPVPEPAAPALLLAGLAALGLWRRRGANA